MQEYSNLGRDSKTLIVHFSATNPKFETKFTDLLINSSSGYLLRSDETLTMNCSADGNPAVTCNWSCSPTNCGSLPNTCEINNVNVVGSTTITCTVGNGVCGGGTTSIDQKIIVVPQTRYSNLLIDGKVIDVNAVPSITRNKTENLTLSCSIENQNEMNTKIVWKKDGKLKSETANLLLNNLLPEDTGSYSCRTSDAFGNFSSSLYINVYYAAEGFAVNDGTTSHSNICTWYIAPPGPRSCTITFSLNPTTYTTTLTKDGVMVTNYATNQPQTSTSQSFVFTRNQPSFNDSGNYTLRINNGIFENTFTFIISVINEVQPTTTTTTPATSVQPTTQVPTTGGASQSIPPPDNLGVIIGAVVGVVGALILIIILVYRIFIRPNKKNVTVAMLNPEIPGSFKLPGYVDITLPQEVSYENLKKENIDPSSTNYENMRNNVSVQRDEEGYVELKQLDPSGQVVTSSENGGYETAIVRVHKEPKYVSIAPLPQPLYEPINPAP